MTDVVLSDDFKKRLVEIYEERVEWSKVRTEEQRKAHAMHFVIMAVLGEVGNKAAEEIRNYEAAAETAPKPHRVAAAAAHNAVKDVIWRLRL